MSAPTKLTPALLATLLIVGGLACRKPAPVVTPERPKVDTSAQDKAKADDEAQRRAEADQKRKAEEAEAARKAEAAKEAAYRAAAAAALKEVHFAFDQAEIQQSDKGILTGIAEFMKAFPQANVAIDGNCDERGTGEYNLALGERRAHSVVAYLVSLGVQEARLTSTSYGKEKPVCTESTDACWTKNRRAHFSLK